MTEKNCEETCNGRLCGYLDRRGKLSLPCSWKRFWFVLDGKFLMFYKSKSHYESLGTCKGCIDFNMAHAVRVGKGTRFKPFQFQIITRTQIIHLSACDKNLRIKWVTALQNCIKLPQVSGPVEVPDFQPDKHLFELLSDEEVLRKAKRTPSPIPIDSCNDRLTENEIKNNSEDESAANVSLIVNNDLKSVNGNATKAEQKEENDSINDKDSKSRKENEKSKANLKKTESRNGTEAEISDAGELKKDEQDFSDNKSDQKVPNENDEEMENIIARCESYSKKIAEGKEKSLRTGMNDNERIYKISEEGESTIVEPTKSEGENKDDDALNGSKSDEQKNTNEKSGIVQSCNNKQIKITKTVKIITIKGGKETNYTDDYVDLKEDIYVQDEMFKSECESQTSNQNTQNDITDSQSKKQASDKNEQVLQESHEKDKNEETIENVTNVKVSENNIEIGNRSDKVPIATFEEIIEEVKITEENRHATQPVNKSDESEEKAGESCKVKLDELKKEDKELKIPESELIILKEGTIANDHEYDMDANQHTKSEKNKDHQFATENSQVENIEDNEGTDVFEKRNEEIINIENRKEIADITPEVNINNSKENSSRLNEDNNRQQADEVCEETSSPSENETETNNTSEGNIGNNKENNPNLNEDNKQQQADEVYKERSLSSDNETETSCQTDMKNDLSSDISKLTDDKDQEKNLGRKNEGTELIENTSGNTSEEEIIIIPSGKLLGTTTKLEAENTSNGDGNKDISSTSTANTTDEMIIRIKHMIKNQNEMPEDDKQGFPINECSNETSTVKIKSLETVVENSEASQKLRVDSATKNDGDDKFNEKKEIQGHSFNPEEHQQKELKTENIDSEIKELEEELGNLKKEIHNLDMNQFSNNYISQIDNVEASFENSDKVASIGETSDTNTNYNEMEINARTSIYEKLEKEVHKMIEMLSDPQLEESDEANVDEIKANSEESGQTIHQENEDLKCNDTNVPKKDSPMISLDTFNDFIEALKEFH